METNKRRRRGWLCSWVLQRRVSDGGWRQRRRRSWKVEATSRSVIPHFLGQRQQTGGGVGIEGGGGGRKGDAAASRHRQLIWGVGRDLLHN